MLKKKQDLFKPDIKIKTVDQNWWLQKMKEKSSDSFIESNMHQVNKSIVISFL